MKTITFFYLTFFFSTLIYSQNYPCEKRITLNEQHYEIKKCNDDTLLIWKNKFNDTLVARIRIIGQDTFETKRSNRRFGIRNGKIYIEQMPQQYTKITKRDTLPPTYRFRIVGKDTIKETAPATYSTKTEMVVVQEDISPGTPMSILTLDSRIGQKNELRPTIYDINAVRKPSIAPDAGFESAETKKIVPNSNPQPKEAKPNESKNKKDKKKPTLVPKRKDG